MRRLLIIPALVAALAATAQDDSTDLEAIRRMTILSEVVIRSDLNTTMLLRRMKEDTTFYKAFRNLRVLEYTSLNNIRMLDKKGRTKASLFSKTRQKRQNGCRTTEVLEERTTGDMFKNGELNYFTAELYASLFFAKGRICGENNIVAGMERNVRSKSGIEKHKEQLKMMFFNPGKKIPGIPFIGNKINIFDPDVARYYSFALDMELRNGVQCYVLRIAPRPNLSDWESSNLVFENITTWFNQKNLEIVARNYDLNFQTPAYNFDVSMEVEMGHFGQYLVPQVLRYRGNWKVLFKSRETGIFTATLTDFAGGN